jgi:RNA polymerase sigma factor (sigma-70 family)
MSTPAIGAAIEAVFRIESARLIGGLMRLTRDLARAEELAQDALVVALEQWPTSGVPPQPGAWLMTTAKRRAIDTLRRERMMARKHAELEAVLPSSVEADFETAFDEPLDDDVLRLILAACHPVLSQDAKVALTLRLVLGMSTVAIARAFLVPEPTIAQRIVRAKRTLGEARVPFDLPKGDALRERTGAVLEVVYLIFNEGYLASSGPGLMRSELCDEARRLARILSALVPNDPEVHGLRALIELQSSRSAARIDSKGAPVLLLDQDRTRWDPLLIQHGLAALARALAKPPLGPYALQAAIASCHARARTASETDWPRIVALYDALVALTGSPVVELNRAVAVGMAFGPSEGLALLDELEGEPTLTRYHLLYAVRADLLIKLKRHDEAHAALLEAASLTQNERERELLSARARSLATGLLRTRPDRPS